MSSTQSLAVRLGVVLLLGFSLWHFSFGLHRSRESGYADDMVIFAQRAASFQQGEPLYPEADRPEAWGPGAAVFKYPPVYITWLLPAVKGGVTRPLFDGLWLVLLAVYAMVGAVAVLLLAGDRPWLTGALFGLLMLNFEPFYENLWHLQLETPFVLALLLVLWALQRRRDLAAGLLVGICASLKIFPAFFLLYFALRRRWRAVAASIGTAIAAVLFSLAVVGLPAHLDFFGGVLPVMLGEPASLDSTNIGVARYVQDVTAMSPQVSKRIAQLLALGALVISILSLRRPGANRAEPKRIALELAMFVPLMALFMPNFWTHYQVLLLFPFLVVTRYAVEDRATAWVVYPLLLVAYALTLFYSPCQPLETGFPCAQTPSFLGLVRLDRGLHDALAYSKVLSNLLLWIAAVVLLWSPRQGSAFASNGEEGASPGETPSARDESILQPR